MPQAMPGALLGPRCTSDDALFASELRRCLRCVASGALFALRSAFNFCHRTLRRQSCAAAGALFTAGVASLAAQCSRHLCHKLWATFPSLDADFYTFPGAALCLAMKKHQKHRHRNNTYCSVVRHGKSIVGKRIDTSQIGVLQVSHFRSIFFNLSMIYEKKFF